MLNFYKKTMFGLGAVSLLGLSAMFTNTASEAEPLAPDPSRPMDIHREMVAKYPDYAERLKQLGVDYQKPDAIEANYYQADKSKANSIHYRLGACSKLAADWKEGLMNIFPADASERRDMKYARSISGVSSSPEDPISGRLPGRIAVIMSGRDTFLINASGHKNGLYNTTYISLTCSMPRSMG